MRLSSILTGVPDHLWLQALPAEALMLEVVELGFQPPLLYWRIADAGCLAQGRKWAFDMSTPT